MVAIDKFDTNWIMVNINKLKLCQYEKILLNQFRYLCYNFCEFYSTYRLWIFSIIKTCHNILGLSSVNGTIIVLSLYCKIMKNSIYYHNDSRTLIWLVSLSSLTNCWHHCFQENYYGPFLHLLVFSLLFFLGHKHEL